MAANQEDVLERVKRLRGLSKEADEEARELVDGERERVKKGEGSLGTPLKDFIFANMLNESQAKELESLENRVNSNVGKQVLVEKKELKSRVHSIVGGYGDGGTYESTNLMMGLVSNPLVYDIGDCKIVIPSDKIAIENGHLWDVKVGPLELNVLDVYGLGEEVHGDRERFLGGMSRGFSRLGDSSCNVLVGTEVEEYFRDFLDQPETRYVNALRALDLGIPEEFMEAFNAEGDLALNRLLRDLGKYFTIPSSSKLHIEDKRDLQRFIETSRNVIDHYGFDNIVEMRPGVNYNLPQILESLEETFLRE